MERDSTRVMEYPLNRTYDAKSKAREMECIYIKDSPQALQMLFPTSSLLQSGVVLVPQFAQLNAPTVFLARLPPGGAGLAAGPLCSPSFAGPLVVDGPAGEGLTLGS